METRKPTYETPGFFGLWGGRAILIAAAIMLIYIGRTSIRMKKSYAGIGEELVENIDTTAMPVTYNGKVVYYGAYTTVEDSIADPLFGIVGKYLGIDRSVEYYQWVEEEYKKYDKREDEYYTYYEYARQWVSAPVNSGEFHDKMGHTNVAPLKIDSKFIISPSMKMGPFYLTEKLRTEAAQEAPLETSLELDFEHARKPLVKALLDRKIHVSGSSIYYGNDPERPEVGDVRVSFSVSKPVFLYVTAKVEKGRLKPYYLPAVGRDYFLMKQEAFDAKAQFSEESDGYTYLFISVAVIAWLLIVWAVHLLKGAVVYPLRQNPYLGRFIPESDNGLTLWAVGTYLAIAAIIVCYLFALVTT